MSKTNAVLAAPTAGFGVVAGRAFAGAAAVTRAAPSKAVTAQSTVDRSRMLILFILTSPSLWGSSGFARCDVVRGSEPDSPVTPSDPPAAQEIPHRPDHISQQAESGRPSLRLNDSRCVGPEPQQAVGRPVLIVVDEILNYVGNGLDRAGNEQFVAQDMGLCSALGKGIIQPAQEVLTTEHRFSWQYMMSLCLESPTVSEGHETLWGKGLALCLAGNYGAAVSVLVPRGRA
ncbi:MAG: hypothetical protein JWN06_3475 [Propionibacteriaceae bacterium]|jgi:hypothetical protein|nr:hypothetical protein [Propionibacteriaceae bacterium]